MKTLPNQFLINLLPIVYATYPELLQFIELHRKDSAKSFYIGYANAHSIVLSSTNSEFKTALQGFNIVYADGEGIYAAAKMLHHFTGKPHNATDFNHALLEYADKNKQRIYFLGTTEKVLLQLVHYVHERYTNITVAGMCDGFNGITKASLIDEINNSNSDILMVGMGQPKQELWLHENREKITVPLCITVGNFFDFVTNAKMRAPMIFRKLKLEWLFRMMQEPRRLWKRYVLGIPMFMFIVLKQKYHRV